MAGSLNGQFDGRFPQGQFCGDVCVILITYGSICTKTTLAIAIPGEHYYAHTSIENNRYCVLVK